MEPTFYPMADEELARKYVLRPGYSEIEQNVAHGLISLGNVTLLDVRTKEEYDGGHIEGALNCSSDLIYTNKSLPFDLDLEKPLLIYCRSGHRAQEVGHILVGLGFKYVVNFGGVLTWKYGLIEEKST